MTVTRHVTRDKRRDSRRTFGWYTEPTLTDPSVKYSTSLRAADERLGRILTGTFKTIEEAAS